MSFEIKFWGVRGSIACPSPRHIRYGGNTSCIEVRLGERRVILDAGTGIRGLGQELMQTAARDADLLLTHTHWDHINGFPFFAPAFDENWTLRVLAGHLADQSIESVLAGQMAEPLFPVPLGTMQASIRYMDFEAGQDLDLHPGILIRTAPLNHPNGATGYRLEYEGRVLCYVTDTEHIPGQLDPVVLDLIRGADLLIYDCNYTEEEFTAHIGWGHSTWEQGVRLAQEGQVRRLAIFHHDPEHEDEFMDQISSKARALWSGAFVAMEDMTVDLHVP